MGVCWNVFRNFLGVMFVIVVVFVVLVCCLILSGLVNVVFIGICWFRSMLMSSVSGFLVSRVLVVVFLVM